MILEPHPVSGASPCISGTVDAIAVPCLVFQLLHHLSETGIRKPAKSLRKQNK